MHISRRHLTILGTILAIGALLLAGTGLLLERFLLLDTYKEQILAELQKSLRRPVTYRSGQFAFRFGPTFTFYDVEVLEPDGRSTFLTTSQLGCKIDLLPLVGSQRDRHMSKIVVPVSYDYARFSRHRGMHGMARKQVAK